MRLQNLGYAVTAHRAQGTTVDTAHVIAAASMTREAFYVAMTRGRYANHAHVITDQEPDTDQPISEQAHGAQTYGERGLANQTPEAQVVLEQILANTGRQLSAHDTRTQLEHQAQQWISRRQVDATEPPGRTAESHRAAPADTRRCATPIGQSPAIRQALPSIRRTRPPATQHHSHQEVIR